MPTRRENEKQLERILSSDTFAESPRLIDLLKKLVESEMEGKKPDEYPNEYTLGRDVFGKPEGWIPMDEATVRQSFANLRKRLRLYYSSEGKLDPVYIGFPRQRGYRPTFLHNDASAPVQRCRRGAELFISTFPEIVRKATLPVVQEFESAIKADPLYAPAYSSLAEALVIYSSCDEPYYFSPRERIPQAEKAAKTALKLDASEWLAQITLGAIHCCHWRWQEAGKAFDAALRIAPEETRAHFWYAAYLIAIGKTAEGKECIGNWLTASPTNKFAPLIKSLFLYITWLHLWPVFDPIRDHRAFKKLIRKMSLPG